MKVYIAGKITGLDNFKEVFGEAEDHLKESGHYPMNPAMLPKGFEYEEYMKVCFAMIDVCEAVCLLPNWIDSPGAKREFEYASSLGKAIFNYPDSKISDTVIVYCDGGCRGNQEKTNVGGFGVYIEKGIPRAPIHFNSTERNTTNNIQELRACIEAILYIRKQSIKNRIKIITDSKYVVDGMKSWVPNWQKRGWKTSSGSPVANRELWEELVRISDNVDFEHCNGHVGIRGNEIADRLANMAMDGTIVFKERVEI